MNKAIKTSLVVATRKRPQDLARLLASLQATKHLDQPDFEVVVVDNTSGDGSIKLLCQQYAVRYECYAAPGKARALNYGIQRALGEYIAFTDDDAIIGDSYWLEKLLQHYKDDPGLGYTSGNVLAKELKSQAQTMWEKKGGLSKGGQFKYWSQEELRLYMVRPWPLASICAGANCLIPKRVLAEVGWLCEFMGPGAPVPHGESLEIGYKIIRAGYNVLYDPSSIVYHTHPKSAAAIKQKLYVYDIGNTAMHMHYFLQWWDVRSLLYLLYGGQTWHVIYKMIKRVRGQYHLPIDYLLYSLLGTLVGVPFYLWKRWQKQR